MSISAMKNDGGGSTKPRYLPNGKKRQHQGNSNNVNRSEKHKLAGFAFNERHFSRANDMNDQRLGAHGFQKPARLKQWRRRVKNKPQNAESNKVKD